MNEFTELVGPKIFDNPPKKSPLYSYQKKEQLALENCDKIQAKYDQLKIEFEQMKLDMANLAKDKETCEMDYEAEISTYKFKLDERDNKIERLEAECDEFQFKYSSKTGGASAIKTIEFIAEIEGCKRDYEMNLEILEEMWHRKVNLSEIEIETYRKKISEYRDIIKELKLSKYEMTIKLDRLEAESEEQTREHKIMIESLKVEALSFQKQIIVYKKLLGKMRTKIEINKSSFMMTSQDECEMRLSNDQKEIEGFIATQSEQDNPLIPPEPKNKPAKPTKPVRNLLL